MVWAVRGGATVAKLCCRTAADGGYTDMSVLTDWNSSMKILRRLNTGPLELFKCSSWNSEAIDVFRKLFFSQEK